ncbi:hypothetical protein PNI0008_00118 [Streptococcus pneumoniae PNI0008]|nr:hypothetical protein PNI0008_00118 [Streptococcus pneumoniae PNI0008]ELU73991.1 hypothetical protein PNI0007_01062 [Streptococcus pneumoniae PNI0007]
MHVVQNLVNIPKLTRIFISKQKNNTPSKLFGFFIKFTENS